MASSAARLCHANWCTTAQPLKETPEQLRGPSQYSQQCDNLADYVGRT
jgi:hypothetical protein